MQLRNWDWDQIKFVEGLNIVSSSIRQSAACLSLIVVRPMQTLPSSTPSMYQALQTKWSVRLLRWLLVPIYSSNFEGATKDKTYKGPCLPSFTF